jgi:AcrR family transcriptional regulator
MSPRTKQQFQAIREEKRALIMRVALELFAEEGFHSASISKISARAGISKGLLYNYFESKEHLIKEIIEDGLDRIFDMLDPNKDGIVTRKEMEAFIELMFDMMRSNLKFWSLYFSLMLQPPVLKLVRDKIEKLYSTYIPMLIKYFESLGHEDPLTDAYIFGSLLDGIGFSIIANPENFPVEKVKRRLIQLYCS